MDWGGSVMESPTELNTCPLDHFIMAVACYTRSNPESIEYFHDHSNTRLGEIVDEIVKGEYESVKMKWIKFYQLKWPIEFHVYKNRACKNEIGCECTE